jgi:L-cystine transport system permease protein
MTPWFDVQQVWRFLPSLLTYLPVTLGIFAGAAVMGLCAGLLLAVARVYRVPGMAQLAWLTVSYARGVPVLVQLMVAYYILPQWLGAGGDAIPAIAYVIAAYGLYLGAHFSEAFRSAMDSLDRGQIEAALSVGMTRWQTFRRVVLPQATAAALPDTGNMLLIGLKSTSLAFSVGVMDMVGRGQTLGAQTMRNFEVFVALSIIYYAMSLLLEWALRRANAPFLRYR